MAFPTTGILDNFNRGNSASLGSNHTEGDIISPDNFKILSNVCENGGGANLTASTRWNVETFGPDSETFCTMLTVPVFSGDRNSLAGRIVQPGAGVDGYGLSVRKGVSDTEFRIQRIDDAVTTDLGSGVVVTIADTDKVGLEIIGTTLKGYLDTGSGFVEKISRTDSNHSAAGNIGLYSWEQPSTGGIKMQLDDFGGGTVVVAGAGTRYYYDKLLAGQR